MTGPGFLASRRLVAFLFLTCLAATQPLRAEGVEDVMWPEHAEAISDASAEISGLIALHLDQSEDAREMAALFNAPALPLPDRLSLAGDWQVRSLQVHEGGAYVYGFFPATLRREGASGLVFEKTGGSQRRIGLILGDYSEDAFLFLGGSYYSDESPRNYSGFDVDDISAGDEGVDRTRDSVGFVRALGDNRLLIVFAPANGKSEMYELKRR